ncbi:Lrp/AsnC family transcriptional regulator [Pseudomonas antarctica]|uniref:Lrp/AsnC family transcriptional regulator n=1 Tax=Pseudomonas antarctica TaxID=219572 RepID=UPI00345D5815
MSHQIDNFSAQILLALQEDGRLSVQDLSNKIGLSTTPTWRRLKSLEESGIIKRYSTELDRNSIGLRNCIFAEVNLERHGENMVDEFEDAVRNCEYIIDCFSTTGQADYLLKVLTPDMGSYDVFLHNVIFKLPGVKEIRSAVVLREVKSNAPLPLLHLKDTAEHR